MADITIRLIYNLQTGKKDIYVDYESESDALPIEHEQGHRQVLADLLGKGVLTDGEVGELIVRRVEPGAAGPRPQDEVFPQPQGQELGS